MKKIAYKFTLLSCFIIKQSIALAQETSSALLEVNPLIMVNQGVGFNYEHIIINSHTIGGDIEFYKQIPFTSETVQTRREIFSIIPKWQYYIFSHEPIGAFIGIKTRLSFMLEEIKDNLNKIEKRQINISPAIQFGYRFLNKSGLTFGIYVGGGIKLFYNPIKITDTNNLEWIKAMGYLEKNNSIFSPEYGLTFGYIF